MERNIKCKPTNLCMIIFMLCLSVRFVEYFLIETDKTAIGENVLHKVVGIILLALVLKKINFTWSDIGFQKNGFVRGILKGLLLGSVCFAVSFGLELAILSLQGNRASRFFCGGESCLYETGSDAGVVWIPYERQMSDWMAALLKIL